MTCLSSATYLQTDMIRTVIIWSADHAISAGSCLQSVTIVYESSAIELQRGWSINHLGTKIDFFETQQHEARTYQLTIN